MSYIDSEYTNEDMVTFLTTIRPKFTESQVNNLSIMLYDKGYSSEDSLIDGIYNPNLHNEIIETFDSASVLERFLRRALEVGRSKHYDSTELIVKLSLDTYKKTFKNVNNNSKSSLNENNSTIKPENHNADIKRLELLPESSNHSQLYDTPDSDSSTIATPISITSFNQPTSSTSKSIQTISNYLSAIEIFEDLELDYQVRFNSLGLKSIKVIVDQLLDDENSDDLLQLFDNKFILKSFLDTLVNDPTISFPKDTASNLRVKYNNLKATTGNTFSNTIIEEANELTKEEGDDAIFTAIEDKKTNIAIYIINKNNNIINKTQYGDYYPIHIAAQYGQLDIIKYIISIDNNQVNKTNNNGYYYPIHYAADYGQLDIFKYIISIDNNQINITNNNNWTPLMSASYSNKIDIVKYLLSLPNINIRTKYNKTALDYAKEKKHQEIIELLARY